MKSIFEYKAENDALREEVAALREKADGISGEYQRLRYDMELMPDSHTLQALQMRICKLESLLDENVQGWRFQLKGVQS